MEEEDTYCDWVESQPQTKFTFRGHEYLSHTADVLIHAWGECLAYAYEEAAMGMLGYMYNVDKTEVDQTIIPIKSKTSGDDLENLLFNFLSEVLFLFHTEQIAFKRISISSFTYNSKEDEYTISFFGDGEKWSTEKHRIGTEVKAVTYCSMKVLYRSTLTMPLNNGSIGDGENKENMFDEVFVVVDI